MNGMNKRNNEKGSLMIEAIVGISLVIVGLLGMTGLVVRSFAANDTVVNRFVGANLAAEGIEVVKNIIDMKIAQHEPWQQIQTEIPTGIYEVSSDGTDVQQNKNRTFCLALGAYVYLPLVCTGDVATTFKRAVTVTENLADEAISVDATVSWQSRGVPQSITVSDQFFKWRAQ